MMRSLVALVTAVMLTTFTIAGCVWVEEHRDRGLHKGQYKEHRKGPPPGQAKKKHHKDDDDYDRRR